MEPRQIQEILSSKLNFSFDSNCIHVTSLLSSLYTESSANLSKEVLQTVFTRGKIYHLGIETIIKETFPNAEIEQGYRIDYHLEDRKYPLCFTPDTIVDKTIIEIKTSKKSYEYATLQTSIYRFLLNQFFGKKIDECIMITGDLKVSRLFCDESRGHKFLDNALKQMII